MSEVGIDISAQEPKAVNRYLGRRFSYVVMLCDRQKERSCPIFPVQSGDCTGILKVLRESPRLAIAPRPCVACAMTFSGM
jgi:protein-tyrosine-phosphatase